MPCAHTWGEAHNMSSACPWPINIIQTTATSCGCQLLSFWPPWRERSPWAVTFGCSAHSPYLASALLFMSRGGSACEHMQSRNVMHRYIIVLHRFNPSLHLTQSACISVDCRPCGAYLCHDAFFHARCPCRDTLSPHLIVRATCYNLDHSHAMCRCPCSIQ